VCRSVISHALCAWPDEEEEMTEDVWMKEDDELWEEPMKPV
jgi:hypothetical protein